MSEILSEPLCLHTCSNGETEALAERMAGMVRRGDVLAFYGDLGAGKTTFVRGLVRGLGSTDLVSSPTFVLMHIYEGRLPVYHFDAYRLSGPQELLDIGADEYLFGDGVACVEWSERAEGILPEERLDMIMLRSDVGAGGSPAAEDAISNGGREIKIIGHGARGCQLRDELAEAFK